MTLRKPIVSGWRTKSCQPVRRLRLPRQMGQTMAGMAGVALRYIQEAVNRGLDTSLEAGLQIEADLFAKVFQTEDVREGVDAFINKRKPNFRHR